MVARGVWERRVPKPFAALVLRDATAEMENAEVARLLVGVSVADENHPVGDKLIDGGAREIQLLERLGLGVDVELNGLEKPAGRSSAMHSTRAAAR